jgi:predicted O-methyltransferase YrrM
MDIDHEFLSGVKGFLDDQEGRGLYDIGLAASRLGPCLEIGSYCGKSAICLGAACRANRSTLFSIDHHRGSEEQQPGEEYFDPDLYDPVACRVDTFREFRKNLETAGLEDTVVPIVCRSETAARSWKIPLGLIFIDGGHTYEAAFTDYAVWSEHILPGGYLLIHDIFEDPEQGGQAPYKVYKIAVESGLFRKLPMIKTIGVLQKK